MRCLTEGTVIFLTLEEKLARRDSVRLYAHMQHGTYFLSTWSLFLILVRDMDVARTHDGQSDGCRLLSTGRV